MLSILIPVYNFDIRLLVQKLHQQGLLLDIPFEIIALEDASNPEFVALNQEISSLEYLSHQVLEKNMGRSKIRNYLASIAQYDYLLFMDCDSMPTGDDYLKNYVQYLAPKQLLYGGRCYKNEKPSDESLYFHWYYGKNREESKAIERQKQPHHSFMTNNFLIPKAIFEDIKFDESLTQYGHEDTLFGLALKKLNIPIHHLDNPLEHIGLEENLVFLKKSRQAIQNLHDLHSKGLLTNEVKLLRYFLYTKRFFLHDLILCIYNYLNNQCIKNFCSPHPRLKLFDFYKLAYLIKCHKKPRL